MTLDGFQGFDDSVAEQGVVVSNTTLGVTGVSRTGSGGAADGSAASSGSVTVPFTATASPVVGFGYGVPGAYGTNLSWFRLDEQATTHISLRFDATNKIALYRGDGTTLLTTSASAVPAAGSYLPFVEVKAVIADSGGSVEVKIGGVVYLTYSGDTRNAGTAGTPDSVRIGSASTGSPRYMLDDLYILNTSGSAPYNDYLGDIVVRTLLPTGNGDSSQFVGSDGNSTDNYLLVDEANSSMTDYVGSATSGNRDLYHVADIPTTYDVLAIQELIYAAASDGGTPPTLLPVAKGQSGTVRTDTALATLSTSASSRRAQIRLDDPDGNPLTAARVNAMQVGVQIQ